ncbi:MAG: DNA-3-methyladenine glycosylase I [Balneolaceae bacterium]|nr:DNA-3-methyladenine glycosylase I [Balneolaceae bacterium]
MPHKNRCNWANDQFQQYVDYHDLEWGVPVHDDRTLFEFLILEGAQAGLSWATILKRREGYRTSFANFDPQKVALFTEEKIQELLQFKGIIRNKLKVRSAVTNAQHFLEIQEEFGSFDAYLWQFVNGEPIIGHWDSMGDVPVTTKESDALSKDLKNRSFKFVGSTIIYAYMQACGLVNDHTINCFRYKEMV